jgi:hypothetical protein
VTIVNCAKTAERIEQISIPKIGMDHRHIVLHWGPDPRKDGEFVVEYWNLGLAFFRMPLCHVAP